MSFQINETVIIRIPDADYVKMRTGFLDLFNGLAKQYTYPCKQVMLGVVESVYDNEVRVITEHGLLGLKPEWCKKSVYSLMSTTELILLLEDLK